MPYLSETPSDLIREKIKESGIKQAHLAKKLGISPQHLYKILNKNQEKSQYLPKMAEILGLDESLFEKSNIKSIQLLTENDLISLADGSVLFEDLNRVVFKSWPSFIKKDYYFFGYELIENIGSRFFKQDLLIFSSSIPMDMTGRIGIAFIKKTASIFTGILIYNKKTIIIYNERQYIELSAGDLLFGVGMHIERNIEKGALV
jgi:transcriptional regulator with XRE-family HTH domain